MIIGKDINSIANKKALLMTEYTVNVSKTIIIGIEKIVFCYYCGRIIVKRNGRKVCGQCYELLLEKKKKLMRKK